MGGQDGAECAGESVINEQVVARAVKEGEVGEVRHQFFLKLFSWCFWSRSLVRSYV